MHVYMYKIYIAMFPGFISLFAFFVSSNIDASFGNPGKIHPSRYSELIMATPLNQEVFSSYFYAIMH